MIVVAPERPAAAARDAGKQRSIHMGDQVWTEMQRYAALLAAQGKAPRSSVSALIEMLWTQFKASNSVTIATEGTSDGTPPTD